MAYAVATTYWQPVSPGRIYAPDDGPVVWFDTGSGDTHLIDALAAEALSLLANGPLTKQELVARLGVDESDAAVAHEAHVDELLEALAAVDLVERC